MTEVKDRQLAPYIIATSISVVPEKFEFGNFVRWLRDFECCVNINGLDAEKKLKVLPTFLRGQASSYFHALEANKKDTYAHSMSALRKCFCPLIAR